MKIILILILILTGFCVADPGDVEITIVIPAAHVQEFTRGFLRDQAIPQIINPAWIADPNIPETPQYIDEYTQKAWIKRVIRRYLFRVYVKGIRSLNRDSIVTDPNMISE